MAGAQPIFVKAKKRLAQAETEYEAKRGVAEQAVEHSNDQLKALGEQQRVALTEVVLRMGISYGVTKAGSRE